MTLAVLSAKILAARGGPLTLAAGDFASESVATLFSTYLGGSALDLADCVPAPDGLSATGGLTIGDATSTDAQITLLADPANPEAAGISIALPLPSWTIDLPFAKVDAREIANRGALNPRLLLRAQGSDVSAEVAGDLTLPVAKAPAATIAAEIPAQSDPPLNYGFEVEPPNLAIGSLSELVALAADFSFDIPPVIPLGPLQLTGVEYIVAPTSGALVSIDFDVRSAEGLRLIPGTIEISRFDFKFMCSAPALPGSIGALVTAPVVVHGDIELDIAASLPDLYFMGSLAHDTPVPLGPFLAKFGISDSFFEDLQLAAFEFAVNLASPFPYSLSLSIEGTQSITLAGTEISLEAITVALASDGTDGVQPSFVTQIAVGGVAFYLGADKSSNGWAYSGGTHGGKIDFAGWIGAVASTFGYQGLPSSLTALSLDGIHLAYDSGDSTQTYSFTCDGELQVSDVTVDASLKVDLSETAGQPTKSVQGTLTVTTPAQALAFAVDVASDANGTTITGTFQPTTPVGLADLFAALGFDAELPDGLDIKLERLGLAYATRTGPNGDASTFVITADAQEYGEAMLVIDRTGGSSTYLFAAAIPVTGSLSDIPVVGSKIPPGLGLSLDGVQLLLASDPIPKDEMTPLAALANSLVAKLGGTAFALPPGGMPGKACLTVAYTAGGDPPQTLVLGAGDTAAPAASPPPAPSPPATPISRAQALASAPAPVPAPTAAPSGKDGTIWVSLQRQLGVLNFHRVGFRYGDATLTVALDVGAALGPFSLSLDGLSMGTPLTTFSPTFGISGIGLGYSQPPLEIAGALLKLPGDELAPDVKFQFDGIVTVTMEDIGLTGIVSFAQMTSGDPSLFAFAELLTPLGGPPPFFVTGLMAGFGFNRSLVIPGMDEVQEFPLLVLAKPPAGGGAATPNVPSSVLDYLEGRQAIAGGTPKAWISPEPGAFWFALGVQFTSFKVVTTDALLIVEPGDDLTVALLGLSTMTLPLPEDGGDPFCFVELQLDATFRPRSGSFAATALLSNNSYVLTPDCHLTGGFAFYSWFGSNPHAGDFVLTLGGYHPAFQPPAHYPSVPRLAFSWAVSDNVSIHGEAYFALTPSSAMGGGGLEVLFHDGDLKAWYSAHADFLMSWRPFWFTGDIDISIGISCRVNLLFCHVTVTLSIGASMTIWGPPTGGVVHIHLVIVTFSVSFGSDNAGSTDAPLQWPAFKALLPHPDSICTAMAGSTIAATTTSDDPRSTSKQRWTARPRGFSFSSRSAIPASQLACDAPSAPHAAGAPDATIAIRPMYLEAAASIHKVRVSRDDPGNPALLDIADWTFAPAAQNVPASLWGTPPADRRQSPAVPSSDLVPDQFVGYDITSPPTLIVGGLGAIVYSLLAEHQVDDPGAAPLATSVAPDSAFLPAASTATIAAIAAIDQDPALAGRGALLASLQAVGLGAGLTAGTLGSLAAAADHGFADAPMAVAA